MNEEFGGMMLEVRTRQVWLHLTSLVHDFKLGLPQVSSGSFITRLIQAFNEILNLTLQAMRHKTARDTDNIVSFSLSHNNSIRYRQQKSKSEKQITTSLEQCMR